MNYIMLFPASTLFYLLLLLVITLLAFLATKSNCKLANIYVAIIILVLSVVAGFRGITVGIDTENYIEVIEQIKYMIGTSRIKFTEMGYAYYVIILTSIVNNPQIVLIVSALITNGLIVGRLWSLRKHISFSFSIFLYISMYYILTFNTMRQWISIAIIFFATKYLFREKYGVFLFVVLLASTFHTTALIALLIIPIFLFYKKDESRKSLRIFRVSILLSPIVIITTFMLIKSPIASQYNNYFNESEFDFSLSWLIKLLIIIFIMGLLRPKSKKNLVGQDRLLEFSYLYKVTRLIVVIGLILRSVGLFFEYTARVGLYYSINEIILFAIVIKSKSYGPFFRIIVTILALITFYLAMESDGYGQMPYVPFWFND